MNLQEDITYEEGLIEILDKKEQVLRTNTIPLVKVFWDHHGVEKATWELESNMRSTQNSSYVCFFKFQGQIFFVRGEDVIPSSNEVNKP